MRTSTQLITAFTGFMLMPLVILFAVPTMKSPDDVAVVSLAAVALSVFLFALFRRSGPKAQRATRLLARTTFPGDPTTPQEVELLIRRGGPVFLVRALLHLFMAGRHFFLMD